MAFVTTRVEPDLIHLRLTMQLVGVGDFAVMGANRAHTARDSLSNLHNGCYSFRVVFLADEHVRDVNKGLHILEAHGYSLTMGSVMRSVRGEGGA